VPEPAPLRTSSLIESEVIGMITVPLAGVSTPYAHADFEQRAREAAVGRPGDLVSIERVFPGRRGGRRSVGDVVRSGVYGEACVRQ
jgi:hypothetical protein